MAFGYDARYNLPPVSNLKPLTLSACMELNRRHRAILFVTLVLTGSALLIGAELKHSLGMMLLGMALAWALGSDAASNSYLRLKVVGRATYGWLRLPLVMMF